MKTTPRKKTASAKRSAPANAKPSAAKRAMPKVTSTEFASRFGHWSLKAQREPVGVVNSKTGTVVGYFLSEEDFIQYLRVRDMLPKSRWAWEMDEEMIAELKKPLPADYPE
jgi:hypothetical protein